MADEMRARPVSGEIMTAPHFARPGAEDGADIVDAEYEIVRTAEAAEAARPVFQPETPGTGGMKMLRRPLAPPVAGTSHGGPAFWAAGFAAVAVAFWLSGGHALVISGTQAVAGPPVALRIGPVESRVGRAGDRLMLFVDSEAINDGAVPAHLPPIEIRVTAANGRVTLYNLGTAEQLVAAGGRYAFSSRLEVPNNGVRAVAVAFRENGDARGSR
ncbi:MAG: hypothetical protein F9K19_16310 [Rhizobiaceae bacterium]|nr:MAG: hypothetical protein F9K19_16310 [Rhizobiaceae bacterium]CAG0958897.1 hypothetical protein RHIZO_00596 [Rhizobiaceae bacterium]